MAGPVENWIAACDLIMSWEVESIVPGHGLITDKQGVARVREYLVYIDQEARTRFEAGMSAEEAALDISLGDFDSWGDGERIAVNVATLYRGYAGDDSTPDVAALFGLMAKIFKERRR